MRVTSRERQMTNYRRRQTCPRTMMHNIIIIARKNNTFRCLRDAA